MKYVALLAALGALLFAGFLSPAPAHAGLSFEDPQLCVNGKLLMIEPTTAGIEVWVGVGSALQVDYNVVNCGGDPNLPVIAPDHVNSNGTTNMLNGIIHTKKHTMVIIQWDGKTVKRNSGNDEWIYAQTRVN